VTLGRVRWVINSSGVRTVGATLGALVSGFVATPGTNANLVTNFKELSQKTEKRKLSLSPGCSGLSLPAQNLVLLIAGQVDVLPAERRLGRHPPLRRVVEIDGKAANAILW
jgi:hypothetical protein